MALSANNSYGIVLNNSFDSLYFLSGGLFLFKNVFTPVCCLLYNSAFPIIFGAGLSIEPVGFHSLSLFL